MPTTANTDDALREKIARHTNWYHKVEVAPGVVTPGHNDAALTARQLQIPEDCTGLRVLDVGARDGYFSFLCEQRGAAEVVAVDHAAESETGFPILKEIFNSKVQWHTANVYDVTPERFGEFDVVLCLGLLYHLRNPLLALDTLRRVCRRDLYVTSHVVDSGFILADGSSVPLEDVSPKLGDVPVMRFYPRNELSNDFTNWWGFNSLCLRRMIESANFRVEHQFLTGDRAGYKCRVVNDAEMHFWIQCERGVTATARKKMAKNP
jgi:tRNA (mo5U34)-methyltransferase